MSFCINPTDPEYIKLLEEVKNPLLAEVLLKKRYESTESNVDFQFKSVSNIISKLPTVIKWWDDKSITKEKFWSKLQQDLQIPKEQISLLQQTHQNMINNIFNNLEKQCN